MSVFWLVLFVMCGGWRRNRFGIFFCRSSMNWGYCSTFTVRLFEVFPGNKTIDVVYIDRSYNAFYRCHHHFFFFSSSSVLQPNLSIGMDCILCHCTTSSDVKDWKARPPLYPLVPLDELYNNYDEEVMTKPLGFSFLSSCFITTSVLMEFVF